MATALIIAGRFTSTHLHAGVGRRVDRTIGDSNHTHPRSAGSETASPVPGWIHEPARYGALADRQVLADRQERESAHRHPSTWGRSHDKRLDPLVRFGLWSKLNAWADRRFYDPVMNWLIKDIPAEHLLSSGSWPRSPGVPGEQADANAAWSQSKWRQSRRQNRSEGVHRFERRHALPVTMAKGFLGSVAEALEWCEDYETALEVREEMWMTSNRHGPDSAEAITAMEWVAVELAEPRGLRAGDIVAPRGSRSPAGSGWSLGQEKPRHADDPWRGPIASIRFRRGRGSLSRRSHPHGRGRSTSPGSSSFS